MRGFDSIIIGMWWNLEFEIRRHSGLHRVTDLIRVRKIEPDLTLIFPLNPVGRVVDLEDERRTRWNISGNSCFEFHGRRTRHITAHRLESDTSFFQDRIPARWINKDNDV